MWARCFTIPRRQVCNREAFRSRLRVRQPFEARKRPATVLIEELVERRALIGVELWVSLSVSAHPVLKPSALVLRLAVGGLGSLR
jgi:hypothetical protein